MLQKSYTKRSLYITMIIVVALTVTSIMTLHGAYSYITIKHNFITMMKQDSQQSLASLQKNIASLIEAYAINEYEQLVLTELERRENMAIIVEDDNMAKILGTPSYISGKIRTRDDAIIDYNPQNPNQKQQLENAYFSDEEIIYNAAGKKLGKVSTYTSDRFLHAELNDIIKQTVTNTLIIISLLVFLLFLTIRYVFLKPLSDIVKVITDSDKDGIPIHNFPELNTLELSMLTASMNNMMATIRQSRQQLQQQHESLHIEKNRFQHVIDGADLGYWDWNYQTGGHIVNDRWLSMLGLSRGDIDNNASDWEKLIHPDDKQRIQQTIQAHIQSGTSYSAEFRMKHRDGHWVWVEGSGAVVEYDPETHAPLRLCGTHRDITDKKLAEEKLKLFARVFDSTQEGIIITDHTGTIVDVNPAFTEVTGYSRDEVIGKNPSFLNSQRQSALFYDEMWQQLIHTGHWQGELWNRTKQGVLYAELLTLSSLKTETGEVQYYVGIFSDITDNKKHQEQLHQLAHYDTLTGLPNRTLFTDRFQQAIARAKRSEHELAVCFLDLDNFKFINDRFGHETGDRLLVEVANRIQHIIREEDTLSRIGGDEFTLLLNDIASIEQCKTMLRRILEALSEPYIIDDFAHNITASIGVTLYPADNEESDTLLRHADQAMYQAKLAGKHRYHFFDSERDLYITRRKLRLEEIRQALQKGQLTLYYQPKLNMVTGKVFGVEALIRWIHPEKGLIPPIEFLPLLDGTDLECEVGDWVIRTALRQLDIWRKQGVALQASVNIASHHLQQKNFVTCLNDAMANFPDVPADHFQLEILESSVLGDLHHIRNVIESCKQALGVSFALDDFGTGYSSLTHIRTLSTDVIKIDQSFIRDLLDDPNDYVIVDSIVMLAKAFHHGIIAEGVETVEHGLMLINMGCIHAQGYGIARPMPASEVMSWLENYSPPSQWLQQENSEPSNLQRKYNHLKITSQQWVNQFIRCIQSSPETPKHWPILDGHKCHFSTWLNQAKQEKFLAKADLLKLQKIHAQLHRQATKLYQFYLNNDFESAQQGLKEIHAIQLDLDGILNNALKHQ